MVAVFISLLIWICLLSLCKHLQAWPINLYSCYIPLAFVISFSVYKGERLAAITNVFNFQRVLTMIDSHSTASVSRAHWELRAFPTGRWRLPRHHMQEAAEVIISKHRIRVYVDVRGLARKTYHSNVARIVLDMLICIINQDNEICASLHAPRWHNFNHVLIKWTNCVVILKLSSR